jgi:hypothetical protein
MGISSQPFATQTVYTSSHAVRRAPSDFCSASLSEKFGETGLHDLQRAQRELQHASQGHISRVVSSAAFETSPHPMLQLGGLSFGVGLVW